MFILWVAGDAKGGISKVILLPLDRHEYIRNLHLTPFPERAPTFRETPSPAFSDINRGVIRRMTDKVRILGVFGTIVLWFFTDARVAGRCYGSFWPHRTGTAAWRSIGALWSTRAVDEANAVVQKWANGRVEEVLRRLKDNGVTLSRLTPAARREMMKHAQPVLGRSNSPFLPPRRTPTAERRVIGIVSRRRMRLLNNAHGF